MVIILIFYILNLELSLKNDWIDKRVYEVIGDSKKEKEIINMELFQH